ncbi:MAG: TPM domain-containing protein, partial [Microbacteriaceae bacterium]|nr:TPM domain-containing protein [Microbacteriaceae bacterium]
MSPAPSRAQLAKPIAVTAGVLLALGGALAAAPAFAEEPFDVGGSSVVDRSGAIGDLSGIEAAVEGAYTASGVNMLVVFVDDFSGWDPVDWVDQASNLSGAIGQNDVLLGVAVEARRYGLSVAPDADWLSDAEYDAILTGVIEPCLHEDEWAAAAIGAAAAVSDAMLDRPIRTGECAPASGGTDGAATEGGGGGAVGWVVG